jgi:hypothetical protein
MVLQSLREHGSWSDRWCGWLWDTTSGTTRILETLVKRGLARKVVEDRRVAYYPLTESEDEKTNSGS